MKRLLPLGAVIGIIFLALGILFLLAAVAAPENWPLAIVFLAIGLSVFVGSLYLKQRMAPQSREEEDREWLPIDSLTKEGWFWGVLIPIVVAVAGAIYLMVSDDLRVWLILVPDAFLFLVVLARNYRSVVQITSETSEVLGINPEFRSVIRQAFGARRVLRQITRGIKENRRQFWTRYLDQADEIVRLVLITAKRASDLRASGSKSFSAWKAKLEQTKQMLDELTEKLATATSETELQLLEQSLADVSDGLKSLDDRMAAAKEVKGYL